MRDWARGFMRFFQHLLLAPASLGLIFPLIADAADLNLSDVNQYAIPHQLAGSDQVSSINAFSDVNPSDWASKLLPT